MRKQGNFLTEALSVRFLFAPFKLIITVLFIVGFLFISSLIAQNWFHQPDLLERELAYTQIIFSDEGSESDFHILLVRHSYDILYWFFFETTGLNTMFVYGPSNGFQEILVNSFYNHQEKIEILNQTLKIISIRLGNLVAYLPLLLLLLITSVFDGFMQRKVRQQNASRESAGIYHRAKYWRTGLVWMVILIYLCVPFAIPPTLLVIPVVLLSVLAFTQAKYLKKYL